MIALFTQLCSCPFQTPLSIIDSEIFLVLQCFDRDFLICPGSYCILLNTKNLLLAKRKVERFGPPIYSLLFDSLLHVILEEHAWTSAKILPFKVLHRV